MDFSRAVLFFSLVLSPFFQGCTPALILNAESGDVTAAKKTLSKRVSQADKDEALLTAIRGKHEELAALLLDQGADANAKDPLKASALTLAVKLDEPATAARLLAHKADVKEPVESYRYAKMEIAKMLLDAGADPNAKDSHGATALAYAACEGHAGLVELWLSRGASVKDAGQACERSHFDIEKIVHVCDDLAPPVDCARHNGHPAIVRLLEDALKKKP